MLRIANETLCCLAALDARNHMFSTLMPKVGKRILPVLSFADCLCSLDSVLDESRRPPRSRIDTTNDDVVGCIAGNPTVIGVQAWKLIVWITGVQLKGILILAIHAALGKSICVSQSSASIFCCRDT